jgi:hypothetical protein
MPYIIRRDKKGNYQDKVGGKIFFNKILKKEI